MAIIDAHELAKNKECSRLIGDFVHDIILFVLRMARFTTYSTPYITTDKDMKASDRVLY